MLFQGVAGPFPFEILKPGDLISTRASRARKVSGASLG